MLNNNLSPEFQVIYQSAKDCPFDKQFNNLVNKQVGKKAIENALPHRDPMLLVDRISIIDPNQQLLVAHYNIANSKTVAELYNPENPCFPPGFQVEAMGQAGALFLYFQNNKDWINSQSAFTHICHADFFHPIAFDDGEIELQVRIFEEDLFDIIIGQCIWQNQICSASVLKGISV